MASVNVFHWNFDDDRISYKFWPAKGKLSAHDKNWMLWEYSGKILLQYKSTNLNLPVLKHLSCPNLHVFTFISARLASSLSQVYTYTRMTLKLNKIRPPAHCTHIPFPPCYLPSHIVQFVPLQHGFWVGYVCSR